MAGLPYGISILAQGLDHRATTMMAAIETHWPPPAGPEPETPG
jgi:hypothetical protein